MFLKETYKICDAWKHSSDGSGLDGTFTLTDGYITNCKSDTGISNLDITGDFEISYKHYQNVTSNSNCTAYNLLWFVGTDNNNGLLIGNECSNRRLKIYDRQNGSHSIVRNQENIIPNQTWNKFTIKYIDGEWSITYGEYSLTYSKTFNPTFIHLFDTYSQTRIKEITIKPL